MDLKAIGFRLFYRTSTIGIYGIVLFGICVWSFVCAKVSNISIVSRGPKKAKIAWKSINAIGVMVSIYIILFYTVLRRVPSDSHRFLWIATYNSEFYREMLMNTFLFYPFGLTLSTLIGPWVISVGFITSLTIESWQYLAGTGLAQGTDVIMNTLGAAIGTVPWVIVKFGVVEKTVHLLKKTVVSIRRSS